MKQVFDRKIMRKAAFQNARSSDQKSMHEHRNEDNSVKTISCESTFNKTGFSE